MPNPPARVLLIAGKGIEFPLAVDANRQVAEDLTEVLNQRCIAGGEDIRVFGAEDQGQCGRGHVGAPRNLPVWFGSRFKMMSPATLDGIAVIAVVSTDPCRTRFPQTIVLVSCEGASTGV